MHMTIATAHKKCDQLSFYSLSARVIWPTVLLCYPNPKIIPLLSVLRLQLTVTDHRPDTETAPDKRTLFWSGIWQLYGCSHKFFLCGDLYEFCSHIDKRSEIKFLSAAEYFILYSFRYCLFFLLRCMVIALSLCSWLELIRATRGRDCPGVWWFWHTVLFNAVKRGEFIHYTEGGDDLEPWPQPCSDI